MVSRRVSVSTGLVLASAVIFGFGSGTRPAFAVSMDEAPLDFSALQQLEQRAEHADLKDQCFLYTQVVHGLTELAGRQMSAGLDDQAAMTMMQVDAVAAKVEKASAGDAKRLKNVELMLEHTTRRLADMVRVAGSEQRGVMQATLKHLDAVHTSVLALVFSR
jgi:hypothetical protein